MINYALFEGDNQISKAHPHREAAIVEAYERRIMISGRLGRNGKHIDCLPNRYEIKPVPPRDKFQTTGGYRPAAIADSSKYILPKESTGVHSPDGEKARQMRPMRKNRVS